jgi:undecaprenyl-diphosphatase
MDRQVAESRDALSTTDTRLNVVRRSRFEVGILLLSLALALLGFEEVVDDVFRDVPAGDLEAQQLDAAASAWIGAMRSPALTQVMVDLSALGSVSVLTTVSVLILGVLHFARNRSRATHFVIVGLGAALIPLVLKAYFSRQRPNVADRLVEVGDLSFPSGHAFGAASIYLFVAIWAWSWKLPASARLATSLGATLLIATVGMSRIYLGVHYATDVMAGVAAGAAWTLLMAVIFTMLDRRRGFA